MAENDDAHHRNRCALDFAHCTVTIRLDMKWEVRFTDRTALVDRYSGLKIEIHANEHPPPHFHVECAAGEASFRISDGTKLNGDLESEARVIRKWHAKNKDKLIRTWNESRPTDCPVGEYKE